MNVRSAMLGAAAIAAAFIAAAISKEAPVVRAPDAASGYAWQRLTEHAAFPPGYNFPVHVAQDRQFVALHPQGTWASRDGVDWKATALPFSGMNSAYQAYIQHAGATWALGLMAGNYLEFTITPSIQRTTGFTEWEQVGNSPSLPRRVFYAAASFRDAMWILGGFDGQRETADIWRSVDGLEWQRVVERAPWAPRAAAKAIVFRGRLFLLGGGRIDGPGSNDVWSSSDGLNWVLETDAIADEQPIGYTPIVFRDHLWLVGANRSGRFSSEMLMSADGRKWQPRTAAWSPRGAVATWTDGESLFVTGGKYSTEVAGEIVFEYRNDVWRMRAVE
jgi:hypothetical protein